MGYRSNGASLKSQISNNKSQACPRILVGDKTQTANHNKQNNSYYQGTLSWFEILEIEHWILFVTWLLRFVISSPAKKLVLECFYRVWQNLASQVLNRADFCFFPFSLLIIQNFSTIFRNLHSMPLSFYLST